MEKCREPGCAGEMSINKKGTYVCPDCGFTATYYDLYPEEGKVKTTTRQEVEDFIAMRKRKDAVLAILRDTESILFQPIIMMALRFLARDREGKDNPAVFQAKEAQQNIQLLKDAKRKRPKLD